MQVQEFMENWLNKVIKGNVRLSSYAIYRGYVLNHINRHLGSLPLSSLKTEVLQDFVWKLSNNESNRLCAKGVKAVFSMLSTAIQCAVEYEYILKNPCVKVRLPKEKNSEIVIFSRTEQERLEKTILDSGDKRNIAVLICLYTGLRLGELCALKWENIDLESKCFKIKYSMTLIRDFEGAKKTKLVIDEPKTDKSKRLLPLPDFLCAILERLKTESAGGFVFTMKNGKPVQPRTLQYIYKRLLSAAGINYRNFHSLRHTFATRAIELGIDIKTISEALGHSNSNITINRYTHSLMEQKKKMMYEFNRFFANSKP